MYQPPIPKTSQAAASRHRYIGHWMGNTEGSPTGLGMNFGRLNCWKIPLEKMVDRPARSGCRRLERLARDILRARPTSTTLLLSDEHATSPWFCGRSSFDFTYFQRLSSTCLHELCPTWAPIYDTRSTRTTLKENSPRPHNNFVSLLSSDEHATLPWFFGRSNFDFIYSQRLSSTCFHILSPKLARNCNIQSTSSVTQHTW